ncbi:MAG TPA: NTP transferase domain-containing protein [Gemmatimonadales bacterium]|nr:NTP transferase domain-containing protein [Gemmatimonadales bacterium]
MSGPTLVILAAGMATRYGGAPKQLEPLGPGGATLMDYSLHDARRSGFAAAVLVIRRELEPVFRERLIPSWSPTLPISVVYQEIPAPRTKPWGTGQAVLTARSAVAGSFAVINADDFYGRSAIASLGKFLSVPPGNPPTAGLVGYPLAATLSEAGGVTRAVLHVDGAGWLDAITEVRGIRDRAAFSPDTVVSMNAWGFPAAMFDLLDARFEDFRMTHAQDGGNEEFLLPTAVQDLIRRKSLRVQVLPGGERWCGVTYPADRPRVETFLRAETTGGTYPAEPWR